MTLFTQFICLCCLLYQLVTPVLRFLGNVFSGPDELAEKACQDHPGMIGMIAKFLASNHRHVIKESLWLLSNLAGQSLTCRPLSVTSPVSRSSHLPSRVSYLPSIKKLSLAIPCQLPPQYQEALTCHPVSVTSPVSRTSHLPSRVSYLPSIKIVSFAVLCYLPLQYKAALLSLHYLRECI